jgi:catechol 2,3-dioxygenase-like lactoylglutathione lyase family enzyme
VQVLQSRVLLRPRDFAASVDFYEDGLGLVRYRDWGDPVSGVVYFLGGGYLELTHGDEDEAAPAGFRLWLQVADLDAAVAELVERGVPVADPPEKKPWGLLEATVHDPDGTELVLVETPVDHPLRRRH